MGPPRELIQGDKPQHGRAQSDRHPRGFPGTVRESSCVWGPLSGDTATLQRPSRLPSSDGDQTQGVSRVDLCRTPH